MNSKFKDLLKSVIIAIGISLMIFNLVCIAFDVEYGGNFSLEGYRMTKMIIGCVIIGLGYGIPTIVYNNDSLPMPVCVLIHMGIGCIVNTITAYAVGWISGPASLGRGIAIQLSVAFIIWFCFMRFYKSEAKRMNDRIREMK